jgi:hypothetical protein
VSRIYWHSPSRDVELRGSERAWCGHIARGPAEAAWDLHGSGAYGRAVQIVALVPEVPDRGSGENYLHTSLRAAQEQEAANKALYAAWKPGQPGPWGVDYEPERKFVNSLRLKLRADTVKLQVAGVELDSADLDMNTALVAGSDPVRLATKIHGWCEAHCWVDGPDRAWLADIIDEGLRVGIFRRGLWYVDRPCDGPPSEQPDRQWSPQGWDDVTGLLRERDDEPVVMSYSVCDSFPNQETAYWIPEPLPDEWVPDWATTPEGLAEWLEIDEEGRAERRHTAERDQWYALPDEEKWRLAMAGLRDRGWGQLSPDTLATEMFSWPVTVYDLFAPDRDERIRAACTEPDLPS